MKNKKSEGMNPMSILLSFLLILLVFAVFAKIFPRLLGSEVDEIDLLISETDDFDEDLIPNLYDKCDCLDGKKDNDGCPGYVVLENEGQLKKLEDECKEKMGIT